MSATVLQKIHSFNKNILYSVYQASFYIVEIKTVQNFALIKLEVLELN